MKPANKILSSHNQAYYNERIRQFESGNYEGNIEVDLESLRKKYE
jgi:hypothetical protein